MELKQYDWLAAIFFQPDYTIQDLADLGVTTDTAELKSRDHYKALPEIQEAFKDDKGQFDEQKFNGFYNSVESVYNTASDLELTGNIINQYTYDPRDRFAPDNAKLRDVAPRIVEYSNPYGQSRGLVGTNQLGAPTRSIRETAQKNLVFDPDKNAFEDYTPNDLNLFSFWERPTLVLAQYDEDGVHEINGNILTHKKGEYKLDEYGNPFYEKLGDRSSADKEVLHVSDILTTDGSTWNKYDFFDSDGLDKSAFGTVAKTVVSILPYLNPYTRIIWGAAEASRQLMIALPELYKSIVGMFGMDVKEHSKTANRIVGFAKQFDTSLSDYGKKHFFSIENIGNIAVDSLGQLMQQRLVWKGVNKLINPKTPKELEFAKKMSLSYMAATSTAQTYSEFKNAGASDQVAGLGALATTLSIWKLMSIDYFREFVLGEELDRVKLIPGIKNAAQEAVAVFGHGATIPQKDQAFQWLNNAVKVFVNNSLANGALNEGIEEVAEEATMDAVKGIAAALNALGVLDKDYEYKFGFNTKDLLSRYGASFIGGAIGGTVFTGYNNYESWKNNANIPEELTPNNLSELVYYFRNGQGDKIKYLTTKLYKAGKLANKNLSFNHRIDNSGENTEFIFEAASGRNSQNDIVFDYLMNQYQMIEDLLKKENLLLNDDKLQALVAELPEWFENLSDEEKKIQAELILTSNRNHALTNGFSTRILSDFQDIATEIIDKETKMHSLLTPNITDSKTPKFVDAHIAAVQKSGEYKTLETRLNQLRKERDEILTGKKSKYYFEQGLFLGTNTLVSGFVHDFGIKRYSRVHYDKNYNELTEDEKRIVTEKYQEYLTNEGKDLAYTAFEIFYNLSDKLSGHINSQNARIQSFRDRLYKDSSIFNEQLGLKQNDLNIINKQIEETGETETLLEAKKQLESEIKELHNNPLNLLSLGVNNLISITGDFDTDIKLLNDYIDLIKNQNGYIDFTDVNKKNLLTSIASVFDLITMSDDTKQRLKNAILNEDLELFTRIAGEVDEMDDIATQIEAVLVKLNSLEKSPSEILIKAALEYLDNGDNIYLELINVFEDFVTSPSIDSFEIQDDTTIENLQTLQSLINIVSSIVLSAGEGDFNFIVNKVHKSNKPVISKNSSEELLKGLNLMSKRIELLLQVGDMNRIAQKTIQKRVYYNMRRKMLESILDSEMKNKIETEFKIDLTQLYTQCEFPEGVSEENFDDYEKAAIKFETLFRDAAYEMLENTEDMHTELINKVFNIYGNKIFADKLTVFSADPNIIIADRDKAIYLLSILASPSSNFYLKYKELIASEQYTLAPLYPQEYTVKLIYSFASNKEFLKSLYECLNKNYPAYVNKIKDIDTKSLPYLNSRTPLNRFLPVILGGAGVGKTKAILYTVYKMLSDPTTDMIVVGPKNTQKENLLNTLQLGQNKGYNINELLEKIIGTSTISPEVIIYDSKAGVFKLTEDFKKTISNKSTALFAPNAANKYLILDEIGIYTAPILEAINYWADINNVTIIAAGDQKQLKSKLDYTDSRGQKQRGTSGIEDFIFLNVPELQTAIRPQYVAKLKNWQQLTKVMNLAYEKLNTTPYVQEKELSKIVSSNIIELLWGRDADGYIVGEVIAEPEDTDIWIKEISQYKNVLIITDEKNKNQFVSLESDTIHIKTAEDAQGLEYDYVILAKEYDSTNYQTLSEIYTCSQRSKKGTLFLPLGGTAVPDIIRSKYDSRAANNIAFDESIISEFKTWRTNLLNKVEGDYIAVKAVELDRPLVTEEMNLLQDTDEELQSINQIEEKMQEVGIIKTQIPENLIEVIPNKLEEPVTLTTITGSAWHTDWKKQADYMLNRFKKELRMSQSTLPYGLKNADETTLAILINKLSWFIKAGYYKTSSADSYLQSIKATLSSLYGRNINEDLLHAIEGIQNSDFTVVIHQHSDVVYAAVGNLEIPLFTLQYTSGKDIMIDGHDVVFNKDNNNILYKKNIDVHTSIKSFEGIMTMSDPKILTVNKNQVEKNHSQYEFINTNSGTTFRLFSPDPFVTNNDLNQQFKTGVFSNLEGNVNSYSKQNAALLAIEAEIPLQSVLSGHNIINATTASILFSEFLNSSIFRNNFRNYLGDTVGEEGELIIENGEDRFSIPVIQNGSFDFESIISTIQEIKNSTGFRKSYRIYFQTASNKKPFSALNMILFMQKGSKYKTDVLELQKTISFPIHAEWKITPVNTLEIWENPKHTFNEESVNIQFTAFPGFTMTVNDSMIDNNVPVIIEDKSEISLLQQLQNKFNNTVSPLLFKEDWKGGIFSVSLSDGTDEIIQYYNGDFIKMYPSIKTLLDDVILSEYIEKICSGEGVSHVEKESILMYAINNNLDNALLQYENSLTNKCLI